MTRVTHRRVRRRQERFSLPAADRALLALPEAQPIIARLFAAVGEGPHAVDVEAHVLLVAARCVAAKRQPCSPYAKATLP